MATTNIVAAEVKIQDTGAQTVSNNEPLETPLERRERPRTPFPVAVLSVYVIVAVSSSIFVFFRNVGTVIGIAASGFYATLAVIAFSNSHYSPIPSIHYPNLTVNPAMPDLLVFYRDGIAGAAVEGVAVAAVLAMFLTIVGAKNMWITRRGHLNMTREERRELFRQHWSRYQRTFQAFTKVLLTICDAVMIPVGALIVAWWKGPDAPKDVVMENLCFAFTVNFTGLIAMLGLERLISKLKKRPAAIRLEEDADPNVAKDEKAQTSTV